MSEHTRSKVSVCFAAVSLLLAAGLGALGCDSETTAESSSPASSSDESASGGEQGASPGSGGHGEGSGHSAEEDREEHDHAMRLGLKMQDISHRFAAIWYAGNAERTEMLDYQIHELRETIEQIGEADIEEHGLDVAEELDSRVGSRAEKLEEAVEKGEREKFRELYKGTMEKCNSCHAATEHGFIEVQIPERNPYPNVRIGAADKGDAP